MNYKMEFINFVTGWPGSAHDSRMFDSSRICGQFERQEVSGILLGDNGYGCRHYLMTPLLRPQTPAEHNYNRCHKVTRGLVERTFGIWKGKFHCLQKGLNLKPDTSITVIVATAVLHNIARRRNNQAFEDLLPAEQRDNHEPPPREVVANEQEIRDAPHGLAARRALIAQNF